MPTFRVHMQRYIEQITTVEVEAATLDEARSKAHASRFDAGRKWDPGDDMVNEGVYAVANDKGDVIWER